MDTALTWLTGFTIAVAMVVAYRRARDPLHPLMYFGPMLLYAYFVSPLILARRPEALAARFPDRAALDRAQLYVWLAVGAFCAGCAGVRVPTKAAALLRQPVRLSPPLRRRLLGAGLVLAAVGLASYLYMIGAQGGFVATYSTPKGRGWAPSGYITSAPLLTLAALMLIFLARSGERKRWLTWGAALLCAAPHLLHAALGARRGAAFLALSAIAFGWYLAVGRRPSWRLIVAGVGAVGLVMIFLASQRSQIYLGSNFEFDQEAFKEAVAPSEVGGGELTTYTWGMIVMAERTGAFGWGRRYLLHALIRPIPKQIWPSKYQDAARLLFGRESTPDDWEDLWRSALGWVPPAGSATGLVGDSFFEFAWGGIILSWLLGVFYGKLWKRAILRKGLWTVLYYEAAAVSVFLVTQGVASSWLYRMAYLGVPTYVLWRLLVRAELPQRVPLLAATRAKLGVSLAEPASPTDDEGGAPPNREARFPARDRPVP